MYRYLHEEYNYYSFIFYLKEFKYNSIVSAAGAPDEAGAGVGAVCAAQPHRAVPDVGRHAAAAAAAARPPPGPIRGEDRGHVTRLRQSQLTPRRRSPGTPPSWPRPPCPWGRPPAAAAPRPRSGAAARPRPGGEVG